MKRSSRPERAGDILKDLVRRSPALRAGIRGRVAAATARVLEENLTPDFAARCFFVSWGRGVVTIGVDSPVYRHELQCFHGEEILDRLRQALPQLALRQIRFEIAERTDG